MTWGPFGVPGMPDMEANWGLVVLLRARGPVLLNGLLASLKGRTKVGSFLHVWGRQTDVETNWGLTGLLRACGPVPLNGP